MPSRKKKPVPPKKLKITMRKKWERPELKSNYDVLWLNHACPHYQAHMAALQKKSTPSARELRELIVHALRCNREFVCGYGDTDNRPMFGPDWNSCMKALRENDSIGLMAEFCFEKLCNYPAAQQILAYERADCNEQDTWSFGQIGARLLYVTGDYRGCKKILLKRIKEIPKMVDRVFPDDTPARKKRIRGRDLYVLFINLAMAHRKMKKHPEALAALTQAQKYYRDCAGDFDLGLTPAGAILWERVRVLEAQKDFPRAAGTVRRMLGMDIGMHDNAVNGYLRKYLKYLVPAK